MTDEQWQTAWKLFQSAGSIPPEKAREFLDTASSDPAVRDALIELLHPAGGPDRLNRMGQRLGRYVLTESLGEGGMGEVYAARDSELGRLVAIKILTAPAVGAPSRVDRLIQEAKAASALNHPNIVTIHEVIRADSRLAIVMELVDGAPLRRFCGSPLPVDQIIRIGEQIARALAAAHSRGIVHCDIKPENVMVRQDGLVKILDFGLARDVASVTHSALAAGTLRYMSPEQSRGEGPAQASDVFSLGIVLYELAAGTHPFERGSIFETLKALNQSDPPPPSSLNPFVPGALDALILSMLAKDPAERPAISAVANQFESRLGNPSALPKTARTPPRRSRLVFIAGTLAAAALAAILFPYLHKAVFPRETPAPRLTERQIVSSLGVNVVDAAISPDGSLLAFADEAGLHLKLIGTGESYPIPSPAGGRIYQIAWFPDNHNLLLAVMRGPGLQAQLWTVSIFGGVPVFLRDDVRDASVSPDGAQIAFTTNAQDALWVMTRSGEQPRKLAAAAQGFLFAYPAWRPGTHTIVYVSSAATDPTRPVYTGQSSFQSLDAQSGKPGSFQTKPGIAGEFSITRDGKLVYLLDGLREIDIDAKPSATAGFLRQWDRVSGYHLTASIDGKRIAVLRRVQEHGVFVAGLADGGKRLEDVRRLKLSGDSNTLHAWTPDGRAVVFESNRDGVFRIFAQSPDRPAEERMLASQPGAVAGRFSPDGKWLYYKVLGQNSESRMMRTAYAGGLPQKLVSDSGLKNYYCTDLPVNFCVVGFAEQNQLVFRRLDPQADPPPDGFAVSQLPELARTDYAPTDWGVSPDGTRIAMVRPDLEEGRIHIVPLDPQQATRTEDVLVKGWSRLQTLNWAHRGRGWYVSNRVDSNGETRAGASFAYVDPTGQATVLNAPSSFAPTWGVPSPDGRYLAFTSAPGTVTVWLIEGF